MRISAKSYFKPTPKKFRILGDTLVTVCAATVISIMAMDLPNNQKMVGAIVFSALGPILKALTNFFTDDVIDPNKS